MRPNKILVISLTRKGGGFEQYTNAILEHFSLPFTIIQSAFVSDEVRRADAKFIPTYKGKISFIFSAIFILPFIFLYFCLMARKYSALFVPHFHFFNIAFIIAFRLHKKPVILVEHDGIVHFGDELPLQQTLINHCINHATHLIFLSKYVHSLIAPKLLQKKPISIIPHGIFAFKGLKREAKVYSKKPTLLFFGRVSKYKGIELLLQAIGDINPQIYEKLIIAGKSSYEYSLAHLSPAVREKIEIVDKFLSVDEIASIFNSAHILIMPYIEASQSGVAAVGIANGMPCVCSDVGGLKEQFQLCNSSLTRPSRELEKSSLDGLKSYLRADFPTQPTNLAQDTRIALANNLDSAKNAESTPFCHSERSEEPQKNRDSSVASLPQNDNFKKSAESSLIAGRGGAL